MLKNKLAKETITYLLVGGSNTLICFLLNYIFTNLFHRGFWLTTVVSYIIGGTYTYILNRKFTFDAVSVPHRRALPKFVINMAVCYVISHIPAKIALDAVFTRLNLSWSEDFINFAKTIIANIVYIVMNYFGQKFFAFKKDKPAEAGLSEDEQL